MKKNNDDHLRKSVLLELELGKTISVCSKDQRDCYAWKRSGSRVLSYSFKKGAGGYAKLIPWRNAQTEYLLIKELIDL